MLMLFAFVGLMALFMGAVALSPTVDRTNRIIAICLFIPLITSSVQFGFGLQRALFGRWLTNRRWRGYESGLEAQGLKETAAATVQATQRLPVNILLPAVLAAQRGGGIDHLTAGVINDREVRAFNIRVRGGGWFDIPAVALRLPVAMAPTMIRPTRGRVKIPPRPGMHPVHLESERFDRSMAVFSTDTYFATAMLDARMMEWLLQHSQRCVIELSDRWAVAWAFPRTGRYLGPVDLIRVLQEFDAQVPRAVPSIFPQSQPELFWRTK
jgi:hypothetical protein